MIDRDGYTHPYEPHAVVGDEYTHQHYGLCVVVDINPQHKRPIKLHCTDRKCFIFCDLNGLQYDAQHTSNLTRNI